MRRYELSDFEWAAIQPHMASKVRGMACVDERNDPMILSALPGGIALGGCSRP